MGRHVLLNDEHQWTAFKQGDGKAYELLYNKYFSSLYNYGHKYTSDQELLEDTIHDLFLKLWKNRETLSTPQSVKNYLFKAFRSQIFDKLKLNKRFEKETDFEDNENDYLFGIHLSPEIDFINSEKQSELSIKLSRAIEHLTERQKEAIFLRFYEEFSYPEVAEILSLTPKATYKLVARAISTLREHLDQVTILLTMIFGHPQIQRVSAR